MTSMYKLRNQDLLLCKATPTDSIPSASSLNMGTVRPLTGRHLSLVHIFFLVCPGLAPLSPQEFCIKEAGIEAKASPSHPKS